MRGQFYLSLLTLYGVVTQENRVLNEKNIDLHIRKKRIIDNSPHPTIIESIEEVPYIVSIHKNKNLICGGTILSPYFILTAAICIGDHQDYHIQSGSSNKSLGIHHEIRRKILFAPLNTTAEENNLLLLIINPPIDFQKSSNRPISLHNGALNLKSILGGKTFGTLSGWGCTQLIPYSSFPQILRSISVSIIDFRKCESVYSFLDERHFCTLHQKKRRASCVGDNGGPFVVDGKLFGVLTYSPCTPAIIEPDVFVKLSYPAYTQWITANLRDTPQALVPIQKQVTQKLRKHNNKLTNS